MNVRHAQAIQKFLESQNAKPRHNNSAAACSGSPDTDIDAKVSYALKITRSYLNHFLSQGIDVHGKNILEIGPGTNFGTVFLLKSLGAKHVAVADRFLADYDHGFHPIFYEKLLNKAAEEFPEACTEILQKAAQNQSHVLEDFSSYKCGLEDLAPVPDNSFDIVVSNAVLEHLHDPALAFAELARVTKTGGYGFHQVDFRNHDDFSHPLEFLLLPDDERGSLLVLANSLGNGWRAGEYASLFEHNGFSVENLRPSMLAEVEYFSRFMPRLKASGSRYATFTEDELRIISAHFTVKKI